MGGRTQGQMGSADPPGKMDEKIKSENMQKRAVFRMGVGKRRYADHIHMNFRMHHFVVKFSKFSLPQAARGH